MIRECKIKDIHDVEYIEVVRGSNAPSQGSNAFLGAINIVTRNPVQYQGTQVKAITGDRSTREGYLSHNRRDVHG